MLVEIRDFFTLWKLKVSRASGYLSIANSMMLLYIFAKQLYDWPFISTRFEFRTFIALAYGVGVALFFLIAEVDWRFIFRREVGFQANRNPLLITECFRSAYMLHQARAEGKDISKAFERLRLSFKLAGYEKEFLEFWEMLTEGERGA